MQNVENSKKANSYSMEYKYEDADHPSAPSQIGHEHYTYDANGNPVRVENDSTDATRELYWDEDNRLMVLSDNGKTSRYTYNHAGERVVKSHGSMEGVYINGAPQGITFHETDEYTLYPASILSVTKNRFTKHYFIGSKRVASRIGSGSFNNMYGVNGSHLTAGQQDYAERLSQIESQKEDYYKKLGIAPGIPTMKGSYADPENTGIGYNTIIKELGDHSVPAEWAQYVKHNTEEGTAPGAPIAWDDPSDPDEAQPGYGFVADGSADSEETYFFHSDHLGSTSYITDKDGNITQYDAYLPYGELLVDEHSSSEEMPYKFNGKEFDEETGLYYYGARYMNPVASIWYGVDQLTEKYPHMSGYVYCHGNPIKLVDPDGRDVTSALIEAAGTFVVSAGASFVENLIQYNGDINYAASKVDWWGATVDASSSFATSLIFSGVSSAKMIKKLSSTRIGRSNLGKILANTAKNMVSNISASLAKGDYKNITEIDWYKELIVALSGNISDAGLGHIAKKLRASLDDANNAMKRAKDAFSKAAKDQNKGLLSKSELKQYRNEVKQSIANVNKLQKKVDKIERVIRYGGSSCSNTVQKVTEKTYEAIKND